MKPIAPIVLAALAAACGRPSGESIADANQAELDARDRVDAETPCEPTMSCAGLECGTVDDGCGVDLDCGACEAPETCGGGGPNQCGCNTTCTPTKIADADYPRGVAVDEEHVYWYEHYVGMSRRPRAGGPIQAIGLAREGSEVVADGTYVIWNSDDGPDLLRHATADPDPFSEVIFVDEVFGTAGALTLDAGRLFFASASYDAIGYKDVASAPTAPPFVLNNTASTPRYLAVTATHLYWHETVSGGTTRIRRMPKSGGAAETVIANAAGIAALAGDGDTIYVANWATNQIQRLRPEGTLAPFASGQDAARGFSFDARYVYWVDWPSGIVLRAPKTGGAPQPLASGQGEPYATATDGRDLYWTNETGDQVMRLPLCGCAD